MEKYSEVNPFVSIVIPVYNSEKSIIKTLDSVINQTYTDYEVIIINDGSKDSSLSLIENYISNHPNKAIYVFTQPNSGVAKARNRGLLKSRGEWIALLDSDDEWLPNKLEVQVKILNEHSNIDFLGCALVGQNIRLKSRKIKFLCRVTLIDLLLKMLPQTSTAMFRKRIIADIGLYDEAMTHAEDGNFWYRICKHKNFYVIPDHLVVYGNGKPAFGAVGLASNMQKMHEGECYNLKYLLDNQYINSALYILFLFYAKVKYWRRLFIVKYLRKDVI